MKAVKVAVLAAPCNVLVAPCSVSAALRGMSAALCGVPAAPRGVLALQDTHVNTRGACVIERHTCCWKHDLWQSITKYGKSKLLSYSCEGFLPLIRFHSDSINSLHLPKKRRWAIINVSDLLFMLGSCGSTHHRGLIGLRISNRKFVNQTTEMILWSLKYHLVSKTSWE